MACKRRDNRVAASALAAFPLRPQNRIAASQGSAASGPEQARASHDAGVANGGKSIEDPPGWREGPSKFYLAYLRDPSGNKICALHRG